MCQIIIINNCSCDFNNMNVTNYALMKEIKLHNIFYGNFCQLTLFLNQAA